ncbi:MAG: PqqD family protein [Campylobacterota bacterium]|nr:PqqD family protein [Campylobacterota bacterium]
MTLDTKIIFIDTVFLQEVDDETIILDTLTQEYFSLNEVGGIFWQVLQEAPQLTDAYTLLKESFDVPALRLEEDLLAFVDALVQKKLISVK